MTFALSYSLIVYQFSHKCRNIDTYPNNCITPPVLRYTWEATTTMKYHYKFMACTPGEPWYGTVGHLGLSCEEFTRKFPKWAFPKFKLNCQICLNFLTNYLDLPNLPNSVKIKKSLNLSKFKIVFHSGMP